MKIFGKKQQDDEQLATRSHAVRRILEAVRDMRDTDSERFDFPELHEIQANAGFSVDAFADRWAGLGTQHAKNGAFRHETTKSTDLDNLVEEAERYMSAVAGSGAHWTNRINDDISELRALADTAESSGLQKDLDGQIREAENEKWRFSRLLGFAKMTPELTYSRMILLGIGSAAALAADVFFFEQALEAAFRTLQTSALFALAILVTVLLGIAAFFAGDLYARGRYSAPGPQDEVDEVRHHIDTDARVAARAERVKSLTLIGVTGAILLGIGILRVVEERAAQATLRDEHAALVAANATAAIKKAVPPEPDTTGPVILQVILVLVALLSLVLLFVDGYLHRANKNRERFAKEVEQADRQLAELLSLETAPKQLRDRADALEAELAYLPSHIADATRGIEGSITRASTAYLGAARRWLEENGGEEAPVRLRNLDRLVCPPTSIEDQTVTDTLALPTVVSAKNGTRPEPAPEQAPPTPPAAPTDPDDELQTLEGTL